MVVSMASPPWPQAKTSSPDRGRVFFGFWVPCSAQRQPRLGTVGPWCGKAFLGRDLCAHPSPPDPHQHRAAIAGDQRLPTLRTEAWPFAPGLLFAFPSAHWESLGGYALIVDAKEEEANNFYRRYGFRPYLDTPNRSRLEGVDTPPQASCERCGLLPHHDPPFAMGC